MTDKSKIEKLATRIGDAVRDGILATSDFVEDIAESFGIEKPEPSGLTRFQEAVFNALNDEYDLAQEPFLELWPELERLLEAHGMVSDTRTRFNDVMDKLAREDELLAEAAQIHRDRAKRAAEARAGMKAESDATVYKDGQRFGPLSEEQIEKSARWVLAQEPGETIIFEDTISRSDRAKIMARAQALKAVLPEENTTEADLYTERTAEDQASTIEEQADRG